MTRTTIRSEDITAGAVDTSGLETDIALLGFKVAANGSLAAYGLSKQTIDAFEDASGVDASASTNESRNAANYYSGIGSVTATGGTITTDGDYTIHKFTSSGTFTTDTAQNVEYLIVGGGGGSMGSGGHYDGGGGAGGMRSGTGHAVTAQSYTITVGAGGIAKTDSPGFVAAGASSFDSISAAGGGCGGNQTDNSPSGGSGGGGWGYNIGASGGSGNTPSTTPSQGNDGGNGVYGGSGGGNGSGGGGGGAGSAGSNGSGLNGGAGGAGSQSSITGTAVYYAAGGGGGKAWQGSHGSSGTGWSASGYGMGGSPIEDAANGTDGVVIIKRPTDGGAANLTLVSNASTADSTPTTGDIVMTYTNGAGTATVNTDLKAYVSRDDGTTWTQATLSSEGTTGGHTILTAHNVDISSQPSGTSMRYKITTHNQSASKETRIQAVSLGWA